MKQKQHDKDRFLGMKTIFISCALIAILGFLAYSNSLNGKFIWDDELLVKDNTYIRDCTNAAKFFNESMGAGAGMPGRYGFYRPIQMLTYMLDYHFWGLNVKGYHFTNILLHISAALAIFWLVSILYNKWLLSLFTGIFFVVHPIHTEAVAYISGRADSLSTVFLLLCFILYIKSLKLKNTALYIAMFLSYIFAILSKENSLILPALLLLYHYSFKERVRAKKFVTILIITFAYVILRFTLLKPIFCHTPESITFYQKLPGFFVAITSYLRLMIFPFNLHMGYGKIIFYITNPQAIFGLLIFLVSLYYVVRIREANHIAFFSIAWFFISLSPFANLYPINAYMAEHWLYLPSIGFFLILAKGLTYPYEIKRFQVPVIVLAVFLLIFYLTLTIRQNNYWRDPVIFYERTLKYAPRNADVHYNLGRIYYAEGKKIEAIASFKKAVELNPGDPEAYYNLGIASKSIGEGEEAIASLKKILETDPNNADVYNDLGIRYNSIGDYKEAITSFNKVIDIDPNSASGYSNLGNIYNALGKKEEAIGLYKKAIELKPDSTIIYYNLGIVYESAGKHEEAIASFKKVIGLEPNFAMAHNYLAKVYFQMKQYGLAIEHCDKAIELGQDVGPEFLKAIENFREKK